MCKLSVTKLILTVKNDQSLCLLAPLRQKKETFNSNMKKMSALARWHHHGWHLIERKELTNKGFDTHIIFSPSNLYLVFTQKWKIHTAASQHITTDEIPKVIMLLAFYNEEKGSMTFAFVSHPFVIPDCLRNIVFCYLYVSPF
jgi:uncharacterized Fe-S radical SAM superfamily protein PflX